MASWSTMAPSRDDRSATSGTRGDDFINQAAASRECLGDMVIDLSAAAQTHQFVHEQLDRWMAGNVANASRPQGRDNFLGKGHGDAGEIAGILHVERLLGALSESQH
ncbi:MAG: hypothetical protein ACYDAG_02530 [Chloroflexota bacterium]